MKVFSFLKFLDSDHSSRSLEELSNIEHKSTIDRWIPFLVLHLTCLLGFVVGVSKEALVLCLVLYLVRMFAITGFYHRYFSHRSFKTSRVSQFVFAWIGATAFQRGPLWWASHHRQHHRYSDEPQDVHSPVQSGFLWSHIGWITSEKNIPTDYGRVKDLAKFPELVFINRFDWLPGALLAISIYWYGEALKMGGADVTGAQFLVWGFISTMILFHGTCSINSIGHMFGSKRFDTGDDSRNNALLALITLGEGWHNNHHKFPGSTRQGYTWMELDISFMLLKVLSTVGIVWDLTTASDLERRPDYISSPGKDKEGLELAGSSIND